MAATKQIGARVGQEAFENLGYLAKVSDKSQGVLVDELINDLTHTIQHAALRRNPALKDNPDLRMNRPGDSIVSTEEPQAWQAIQKHLTSDGSVGRHRSRSVKAVSDPSLAARLVIGSGSQGAEVEELGADVYRFCVPKSV